MPKHPSMADLARSLGLSKNAVSLALAGKPGVSDATRAAVRQMAHDLGYPIPAPRSESTHDGVALVVSERLFHRPASYFFGPLLVALQQALSLHNTTLTLFSLPPETAARAAVPDPVEQGGYQAAVAVSDLPAPLLQRLAAAVPLVLVDHYAPALAVDHVLSENEVGAHIAVRHLASAGAARVGFLGQIGQAPSYEERWRGFQAAVASLGMRTDPAWCGIAVEARESAVAAYYEGVSSPPDAWFCANDLTASLLLAHLRSRGTPAPDAVQVVGFDDLDLAQTTDPPLTTVHVEQCYIARTVAEVVRRRLTSPDTPHETIRVVPRLIVRQSTRRTGVKSRFGEHPDPEVR